MINMTINVDNLEAKRLVQELSELTGENISEIIIKALAEKIEREKRKQGISPTVKDELLIIAQRFPALSISDMRSEQEILGYEKNY